MKKFIKVLVAVILVVVLGLCGYNFVKTKVFAKSTAKSTSKNLENIIVNNMDNNVATDEDKELVDEFVDLVNNLERTKAYVHNNEGIIYVVVNYYPEEGDVVGDIFTVKEIKNVIGKVREGQ